MRLVRPLAVAILAIILTATPGHLRGQNVAQVWTLVPATGSEAAFEAAFKDHIAWRKANGETWNWDTYQIVTGPNQGQWVVRSGGHEWSDFDDYDAGFGPEGGFTYQATVGQLTASASMTISVGDTTRSRLPDDPDEYNLFNVITWNLKPGSELAFNEAVSKYTEAIAEADLPLYYAIVNPRAGSVGPSVVGVFFEKNWAGFGSDDGVDEVMIEKYGQEGFAEVVEQLSSSIVSNESQIIRIRRDLSIVLDGGM